MFKNSRFRKVLLTTLSLMLVLSTVVVAANNIYEKKLTATHGRIKFKVDGKDVTKEIEGKYGTPAFTVHEYDHRAYVPLRSIAELMDLEIKYDDNTHTAEIIDVKSEEYEAEIDKLEKKVAKLEKELEGLKKNVVEETDLKTLEKKLNTKYGTYKYVQFDIILSESKNNINVSILVDFINAKDEYEWNRMGYSHKKSMIEDITNMISTEFTNADISGTIYDNYYKKDILVFTKKKNGNVSISERNTTLSTSDRYLDDTVENEFYKEDIYNAYISKFSVGSSTVDIDISFSDRYDTEWYRLSPTRIASMLDRVADDVGYDYYYDHYDYYDYYDYRNKDIRIYVYMGNVYQGEYRRSYNSSYGTFYER